MDSLDMQSCSQSIESRHSILKCKPFVSALKANQKSIRCDSCFRPLCESDVRTECQVCHQCWYCSDGCRNEDADTHRFECHSDLDLNKRIAHLCSAPEVRDESDWTKFKDPDEYYTQTLLLLRIIFKLKSDANCATQQYALTEGVFVSYNDINAPECQIMQTVSHLDEEEEEESDQMDTDARVVDVVTYNFCAWLSVVREILETDPIRTQLGSVAEELLMRAFRIVVRYTLYVCDTTFLTEIGKAIYVEMCFVGHSCVPNCCPLFDGNNTLDLRLLDQNVRNFSDLRYDYQIEMTGYSAQELADALFVRDIHCECPMCSDRVQPSDNVHKNVTKANLKYGNWPTHDYSQAMYEPIGDALESLTKIYGKYHPWITALLLWKFKIALILFNSSDVVIITKEELFDHFQRLKQAICVTHGSDHMWTTKLNSIDKQFEEFINKTNDTKSNFKTVYDTIEQIIPRTLIEQKLT